jgi:hypothetical protein
LIFLTEQLEPLFKISPPVSDGGQAVNGVAYLGNITAVSTRAEIVFYQAPTQGSRAWRAVYRTGAHGVVASRSGHFIAPAGRAGVLIVGLPTDGDPYQVRQIQASGADFNFYKAVSLHATSDISAVACATRLGGVAAMPLSGKPQEGQILGFAHTGLDVVDLCPLSSDSNPFAVCAIGKTGTFVFFRDVLTDREPVTFTFDGIEGTAYRVLSSDGHLLLLTSTSVYVFGGLAKRLFGVDPVESSPMPVRRLPLEAVDANLVGNRWLLVVMPNEVLRIDLQALTAGLHAGIEDATEYLPKRVRVDWRRHTGKQQSNLVALGA